MEREREREGGRESESVYARIRLLRVILREHACVCVWVIEAEGRGGEDENGRETGTEDMHEAERRANINSLKHTHAKYNQPSANVQGIAQALNL